MLQFPLSPKTHFVGLSAVSQSLTYAGIKFGFIGFWFGSTLGQLGTGARTPLFLIVFRSHCPCTSQLNLEHFITFMSTSFNFLQINIFCCNRRKRSDQTVSDETASDIGTFSDFELVHSATSQPLQPVYSRAKLRWVRATLAAILRQRVVKAFNQLGKITRHNKAIGVPDPAVSRLWGQTGNWLKNHKL